VRALAVAMLALVLAGCSQREALTAADRAGERVAVPAAPVRSFAVGLRRSELRYATARGATRATRLLIWYPTSGVPRNHDYGLQTGLVAQDGAVAEGRWPVVLFSHGFLSGAERSAFITENLARRGYVVAAPDHADGIVDPTPSSPRLPRFTQPEAWDDATFRERREDLVATLDLLEREDAAAESWLSGRLDPGRVAAMGHSLGGYTALGLGGLRESWRDARVRAVVALSPYAAPYLLPGGMPPRNVPTLLQGGTLDFVISPRLPQLYDLLSGPKYSLVLQSGNHFAWTNLGAFGRTTLEAAADGNSRWIVEYSVAFLDEHVRGDPPAPLLRQPNDALASFAWDEGAGP
jgi:predicted dienelactone hydrolase